MADANAVARLAAIWERAGETLLRVGTALGMACLAPEPSVERALSMTKLLTSRVKISRHPCGGRCSQCTRVKKIEIPMEAAEMCNGRLVFGIHVTLEGRSTPLVVMRSYRDFCDLRRQLGPAALLRLRRPFPRAYSPGWRWSHRGDHAGMQVDALRLALMGWLQAAVAHELAQTSWGAPLHGFFCDGSQAAVPPPDHRLPALTAPTMWSRRRSRSCPEERMS